MLDHIRRYPWVIRDICSYRDLTELMDALETNIIVPAEMKVRELRTTG